MTHAFASVAAETTPALSAPFARAAQDARPDIQLQHCLTDLDAAIAAGRADS